MADRDSATVDEGDAEDSDDDEPINPLVDALFDEVEELRMQAGVLDTSSKRA
jgi:hypothetical protein